MYKNIIPGLLSFDTELKALNGFYFSDNFDFYNNIKKKSNFHYKLSIDSKLQISDKYDFRNGFYFRNLESYYYHHGLNLKFKYDYINKEFVFNKFYSLIPFEIGRIFPVGKVIADIIDLDLFLDGYIIFRASFCFQYKGQNIGIIAPSFNGKTTFLEKILNNKNARYISEDNLIIDIDKNVIYPTMSRTQNKLSSIGSRRKTDIRGVLSAGNTIYDGPVSLDKLFIIVNSTTKNQYRHHKTIFEAFFLKSLYFLEDFFVRSYIFENNLTFDVYQQISKIKNLNIEYKFLNIKNFNFNSIFEN